jgi:endonuclease/exonuclease/phosphatase family metal-dependent hydrolase
MFGKVIDLGLLIPCILVGLYLFLLGILKLVQRITFTPMNKLERPVPPPPAIAPKTINFLQLNVFWRPKLIHLFKDEFCAERANLLGDRLNSFDIVCLNEAFQFGSHLVKDFVESMRTKGFPYAVSSKPVSCFSKHVLDSGLLILSKFPIVRTDSITYSKGCSFDAYAAKGCLFAGVSIGDDRLINVFTTHLQASYGNVTDIDFDVRSSQVKELQSFIARYSDPSIPNFLLGDMNTDSREEGAEYGNMMNGLAIPDWELTDTLKISGHPYTIADWGEGGGPGEKVLTQKSDWNWPKSIDYVFIYQNNERKWIKEYSSEIVKFEVTGKAYRQLSDHYGIRCRVETV